MKGHAPDELRGQTVRGRLSRGPIRGCDQRTCTVDMSPAVTGGVTSTLSSAKQKRRFGWVRALPELTWHMNCERERMAERVPHLLSGATSDPQGKRGAVVCACTRPKGQGAKGKVTRGQAR